MRVFISQPQLTPGDQPAPYVPGGAAQTQESALGLQTHLQWGSTTAFEAGDPGWTANGVALQEGDELRLMATSPSGDAEGEQALGRPLMLTMIVRAMRAPPIDGLLLDLGDLQAYITPGGGLLVRAPEEETLIPLDLGGAVWHHLILILDPDGQLTVRVDGRVAGQEDLFTAQNLTRLRLGGGHLAFQVCDLAVYHRVPTKQELFHLHRYGLHRLPELNGAQVYEQNGWAADSVFVDLAGRYRPALDAWKARGGNITHVEARSPYVERTWERVDVLPVGGALQVLLSTPELVGGTEGPLKPLGTRVDTFTRASSAEQ